jgi:hypothetical protein
MTNEQNARILHLLTIAADNAGEDQRDPVVILDRMEAVERLRLDERTVTLIEAWYGVNDTWAAPADVVGGIGALRDEQNARRERRAAEAAKKPARKLRTIA